MVDGFCQSHEAKARLKLNVSGIKLNKTERNRHVFQFLSDGGTDAGVTGGIAVRRLGGCNHWKTSATNYRVHRA